jgi:hypothetical protein
MSPAPPPRHHSQDASRRKIGDGFGVQRIDPHRARDVLDALLAQILESISQLVPDLVAHHPRDADPTGRRKGFEARRDIDTVTEQVIILDDDIAEVDPDPELYPAVLRHLGFAIDHRPLQLSGAADSVDDAREFRQHPVAGGVDDAAGMLADLWVDELAAMRLEASVRAFLIRPHQTRVARDIGGEDRGKTAGCGHSSGIPASRSPVK